MAGRVIHAFPNPRVRRPALRTHMKRFPPVETTSDLGLTLRVYAHLMPPSHERARKAAAAVFDAAKTMRHDG